MTSIGETFKELLERHHGETFSVEGGSRVIILTLPETVYAIDSRGIPTQISGKSSKKPSASETDYSTIEKASSTDTSAVSHPFSEADYPTLEKLLLTTHRLYLDPSEVMEDSDDIWDAADKEVNYLPLGVLDFPGHLPFGWSGSLKDYLKFGSDEKGLYVDVSYIPLGTVDWLSSFEDDLKRILKHTSLDQVITFEQFKADWQEEAEWILNHFSSSEIYDLTFELVEEKDAKMVTPSVGEPLEGERFSVEYKGKFYSIYIHCHED